MTDVTVKTLDQFQTGFGGGMRKVRAGLGVSSFGMQVIELPANFFDYPQHSHSQDAQEEVYTPLDGSVTLRSGGEDYELVPGTFARVGPGEERELITGERPVRLLALGGVPGKAYEAPEFSEESAAESG